MDGLMDPEMGKDKTDKKNYQIVSKNNNSKISRIHNNEKVEQNDKLRKQKRARIIIRNISYKANEEILRKHFKQFGEVTEVQLLKKPDGKLVGCAFMQFATVNQAAKAILKSTNQEFLGRVIYVDWAVGKDKYSKTCVVNKQQDSSLNNNNKSTLVGSNGKEIKDEDTTKGNKTNESEMYNSDDEDNAATDDDKMSVVDSLKSEAESDDVDEEDEEDDGDNESLDDDNETKFKIKEDKLNLVKNQNNSSLTDDVKDGCTVFLKNVPFDATSNDIKATCQKFGPIVYALINIDQISGHSKGTAFVKFKRKESADLLLNSSSDQLILRDQILETYPALNRLDIKQKLESSKQKTTDSRNLYLAKEGLIMAGSKASDGVSASDMAKRHQLEKIKGQILRNLNRFVSRNRLSIHNLPLNYDDDKLKEMIIKFTNLKPHECRVMREKKPTMHDPKGKSKGFGFMSFSTHNEALFALRKLNNNPAVFGQINRPIVAFSIEDRAVHNVKEKRLLKSQRNNPTYNKKGKFEKNPNKKHKKNNENGDASKETGKGKKNVSSMKKPELKTPSSSSSDNNNKNNSKKSKNKTKKGIAIEKNDNDGFMGTLAKPGEFIRSMRSDKKLKEQSKEHGKKVAKLKRLEKRKREKLQLLKEKRQIDRTKRNRNKRNTNNDQNKDNFSNLVEKYRKLIDSRANYNENTAHNIKKSNQKKSRLKWYEE